MTKNTRRSLIGCILAGASAALLTACNTSAPSEVLSTMTALAQSTDVTIVDPYAGIYASKGAAYRTIVGHSFYNTPICQNGQPRGNSRIWGDAPVETQRFVIEALREAARNAAMTKEQEAMVLAIARHESGFNPDAAAGTTSAHSIGQFIRSTGEAYGLTDANRWDIPAQAKALVAHTLDNYAAAERRGLGPEYVYARHHDGSLDNRHGGRDIALQHVMPSYRAMLELVERE